MTDSAISSGLKRRRVKAKQEAKRAPPPGAHRSIVEAGGQPGAGELPEDLPASFFQGQAGVFPSHVLILNQAANLRRVRMLENAGKDGQVDGMPCF